MLGNLRIGQHVKPPSRTNDHTTFTETRKVLPWDAVRVEVPGPQHTPFSRQLNDLFSDDFLLPRPLLKAITNERRVVLLVDEVDKADVEFEAFLLEVLSDFQVSIPELGTVNARQMPFVVLTSNRTRDLSEALRRPFGNIYFAGDFTESSHSDGAAVSARRVSEQLIERLGAKKSNPSEAH